MWLWRIPKGDKVKLIRFGQQGVRAAQPFEEAEDEGGEGKAQVVLCEAQRASTRTRTSFRRVTGATAPSGNPVAPTGVVRFDDD